MNTNITAADYEAYVRANPSFITALPPYLQPFAIKLANVNTANTVAGGTSPATVHSHASGKKPKAKQLIEEVNENGRKTSRISD